MIADDVSTYLAQELYYKKGVNLFVNNFDIKKTEYVLITDTGSVNIENYVNLDEFTIQIMVVSKDHATAKAKSIAIYNLLNRKQGLMMGTKCMEYVKAIQSPYSLGYEDHTFKMVTNYVMMTSI